MKRGSFTYTRNAVLRFFYRRIFKPLAFTQNPETIHNRMVGLGAMLGRSAVTRSVTRAAFRYDDPILETTVAGIHFCNPIGLAAGFDKGGRLTQIIDAVGFGFAEIGSITGTPCPGNPKPRLWRLPKSRALLVHLGLNSIGSAEVAEALATQRRRVPIGISIAKANLPATDRLGDGINDYAQAARDLLPMADYVTVNISCPNTTGGTPFLEPENLHQLLDRLDPLLGNKPVFIKLPADKSEDEMNRLVDVALRHRVTGFIAANLTTDHSSPDIQDANVPPRGGLSGKVVEAKSNRLIRHLYRRLGPRVPIIGLGGVFSADDAYTKIRLGASLVQLVTGMIYEGPQLISSINAGLGQMLRRDGFTSVGQAVGIDA